MLKLLKTMLLIWLVLPAICQAIERDILVVSIYPKNGVYQKDVLTDLVSKIEAIWTIKNKNGQSAFKSIDSLASENIIVSQDESVRFRRLIEQRELTESGLIKLKKLVNSHPLLHDRLVDESGEQLHVWLNLSETTEDDEKLKLLQKVSGMLSRMNQCEAFDNGIFSHAKYQEWILQSKYSGQINEVFSDLNQITNNSKKDSILAYSATDLILDLKRSMEQGASIKVSDSAEIEQLYMIAESVRSRHLHELANPNFTRLKLIRLSDIDSGEIDDSDFIIKLEREWKASKSNYQVLDCRKS